jgi:hypothetical protein
MSITADYTRTHLAIAVEAKGASVDPFCVRVLLALHDCGGSASTAELEDDLASDGAAVRRALLALYPRKLAMGAGADGGPRRPGVRTVATLTDDGRSICERIALVVTDMVGLRSEDGR